MFATEDRRTILLANPRCASTSIISSLHMEQVGEGGTSWLTLNEARSHVPRHTWREADKILVLRDPCLRFLSALDLLYGAGSAGDLGMVEQAVADQERQEVAEWPRQLWPQVLWVTGHVDYLVGLPWLHELWNHKGWRTLQGRNRLETSRSHDHLPLELRHRVAMLYEEDYKWMARNPVWHPEGRTRFLLTGDCVTCDKLRQRNTPS